MRVKCPNSDIYLDLPGDKMDMKFTCPACKKVHRVTVTITTPGEIATTQKLPPQMPKKYATGAFPPVVDIPIDADFVLFDANAPQQIGIDLGQAADAPVPPFVDERMSERKTEIRRDPPQREQKPEPAPEPAAAEKIPEETVKEPEPQPGEERDSAAEEETPPRPNQADAAEAEKLLSDNDSTIEEEVSDESAAESESPVQPEPQPQPERIQPLHRDYGSRPAPKKRGPGLVWLLVLIILAGIAFLAWQHYLSMQNRDALNGSLREAEDHSLTGDMVRAAASAGRAEEALARVPEFHTVDNLWNRLASSFDFLPAIATDISHEQGRIAFHAGQKEIFDSFRSEISSQGIEELPAVLAGSLGRAEARNDAGLALALKNSAVDYLSAFAGGQGTGQRNPEEVLAKAMEVRRGLAPLLDPATAERLESGLAQAAQTQTERVRSGVGSALAAIDELADNGDVAAVTRYRDLRTRLGRMPFAIASRLGDPEQVLRDETRPELANIRQVRELAEVLDEAQNLAWSALSVAEPNESAVQELVERAETLDEPNEKLAEEAARLVDDTRLVGEKLLRQREDLYFTIQAENRRGKINPGTMTAWRLLLAAFGNDKVALDPDKFHYDSRSAEMLFILDGLPLSIKMTDADFELTVRAAANGYNFTTSWSPFLNKPISWIANLAAAMREAGVDPDRHPDWEVLEGPGELLALTRVGQAGSADAYGALEPGVEKRYVFFDGVLREVDELPRPEGFERHGGEFRKAAERLHDGVMASEAIPQQIRQALKPILMGTYLPIDPRDYFDAAFCRRLIEADYLETYIKPMPDEVRTLLDDYRQALNKVEAGHDEFAVALDDGQRLVAVARQDQNLVEGKASDQDSYTGEIIPRYTWRVEAPGETVFYSPMSMRFSYAFSVAEHYPGSHRIRPPGVPDLTRVWHATKGAIASYAKGADRAEGDPELWDAAIGADVGGPLNPVYGPPGWNFPMHVLERNDQDDPVSIATLDGVVPSPNFTGIADPELRLKAEDEWLDATAATLSTPGELGLIFHQFFRYCSDSPMPEHPNLIGSHYGVSDTHQTVYQSLERRWVGRLIGDCDDLAEVFQVLTRKQGKLSYVMNLPAHAACGYVDRKGKDDYQFVVLQTGQVLQFNGETLNEVVEDAYRYFDRSAGESHLTMDAVPLLLRFADEETRTPFVLSSRIYEDRDYADAMIRVQGYWHEHVFSAGIREMEEMLKTDREIGSLKELGSLYERVGMYEQSAELRRQELELVKDNPQAKLSTLLEISQLHIQDRDKPKALAALHEMEDQMLEFTRNNNVSDFMRAMSFRSQWAVLLSRLGEASRAWNLVKYDVDFTKRQQGYIAEPVLRTLVVMYDKMSLNRDNPALPFSETEQEAMTAVEKELETAFVRGVFKDDDAYTQTIMRYFFLGRFAVAREGRARGLETLNFDGPYPQKAKDQTKRGREITEEDWSWMRISPQLYLAYGMEMLDQEEFPNLYDPAGARTVLENVARAVEKGAGLGSDFSGGDYPVRSGMALSFINRDIDAFRNSLSVLTEKDYSSLYDDAAMTFGLNCGLIPLTEFDAWIEAFRDYFPGKQHYFKVVYRAIDKENYDHALKMAEATARFFPDEKLLVEETEFVRKIIPDLKRRKAARPQIQ